MAERSNDPGVITLIPKSNPSLAEASQMDTIAALVAALIYSLPQGQRAKVQDAIEQLMEIDPRDVSLQAALKIVQTKRLF